MKDGAIMCNAGHFNVEIDTAALEKMAECTSDVKANIKKIPHGQRQQSIPARRRAIGQPRRRGDGHPAEIMDLSFALQYLSMEYLRRNRETLPRRVLPLPAELDRQVAMLKLESLGAGSRYTG